MAKTEVTIEIGPASLFGIETAAALKGVTLDEFLEAAGRSAAKATFRKYEADQKVDW